MQGYKNRALSFTWNEFSNFHLRRARRFPPSTKMLFLEQVRWKCKTREYKPNLLKQCWFRFVSGRCWLRNSTRTPTTTRLFVVVERPSRQCRKSTWVRPGAFPSISSPNPLFPAHPAVRWQIAGPMTASLNKTQINNQGDHIQRVLQTSSGTRYLICSPVIPNKDSALTPLVVPRDIVVYIYIYIYILKRF